MERMPKNTKNIDYELDRLSGYRDSGYTEYVARDWAKQYNRQGDRKSQDRCERAVNDMRRYGSNKK